MRHSFQSQQWLPFPLPTVFAFFANPQNLPPLMPRWQRARIEEVRFVAPPAPPAGSPARLGTGAGTTMVLSFRLLPALPLRMRWHALITEFAWNDRFCDLQTSGPFFFWKHCHTVAAEARDGVEGTLVRDHVDYQFPFGPLGDVANALGGRLQIGYLFRVRQQQTALLLPRYAAHLQRERA